MSVFNDERYLRSGLECILMQEGVDLELIIVNDGSSDSSPEILAEYAERDARIRLIHQENRGLTQALIRGCSEAHGKYIARQDPDDVSLAGRLSALLQLMNADRRIAFASSWAKCVGPEDESMFVTRRPEDPCVATHKLLYEKMGPPAHGSVMFRRDLYEQVGGYRREFYYAQDSDLWHRLAQIGRVAYVPKVLYVYRFQIDSISGEKHHLQQFYGELGQACLKARLDGRDDSELLEQVVPMRAIRKKACCLSRSDAAYFIGSCLLARKDVRARKYLLQSAQSAPWKIKAWYGLLLTYLRSMATLAPESGI